MNWDLLQEIRDILADGESVYLFLNDDKTIFAERASLVGKTTDKKDRMIGVVKDYESYKLGYLIRTTEEKKE